MTLSFISFILILAYIQITNANKKWTLRDDEGKKFNIALFHGLFRGILHENSSNGSSSSGSLIFLFLYSHFIFRDIIRGSQAASPRGVVNVIAGGVNARQLTKFPKTDSLFFPPKHCLLDNPIIEPLFTNNYNDALLQSKQLFRLEDMHVYSFVWLWRYIDLCDKW